VLLREKKETGEKRHISKSCQYTKGLVKIHVPFMEKRRVWVAGRGIWGSRRKGEKKRSKTNNLRD